MMGGGFRLTFNLRPNVQRFQSIGAPSWGEVSVLFFSTKKTYSGVFISVLWSTPNVLKSSTLYDTEVIRSASGFSTKKKLISVP